VNLLLSTQLFFVVVAVDPRWLFAALNQHRRHLLTATAVDQAATPPRAGSYQATALLLAILVSDPGHVRGLPIALVELDTTTSSGTDTYSGIDIDDALRSRSGASESDEAIPAPPPNPAVQRLINTITDLRSSGAPVQGDVATYRRWARVVARYCFDTYQLYTEPDDTR